MASAFQNSDRENRNSRDRIIDSLMELAAERSWDSISISDIAGRADLSIADFRDSFPSKGAVLGAFSRQIDREVLSSINGDLIDESGKERLFDVLMRRLDAMAPYKAALKSVFAGARRDPLMSAALNRMMLNSLRFMTEAANLRTEGAFGHIKLQGLALLWTRVVSVWLKDEEEGWPATMAELDRGLARAETVVARSKDVYRLTAPLCDMAASFARSGRRVRHAAAERFRSNDVSPDA